MNPGNVFCLRFDFIHSNLCTCNVVSPFYIRHLHTFLSSLSDLNSSCYLTSVRFTLFITALPSVDTIIIAFRRIGVCDFPFFIEFTELENSLRCYFGINVPIPEERTYS